MVARRPRLFLWPMLLLSCAAVGISVLELQLSTGRHALVDPAAEYAKTWKQYVEDFGGHGDLIVVVESDVPDRPLIQAALNRIGERLERESDLFRDVLYRIDRRTLRRKELQLLSADELRTAGRRLERYVSAVQQRRWDQLRLEAISERLRRAFASVRHSGRSEESLIEQTDRLARSLDRFLDGTLNGVRYDSASFPSPWQEVVTVRMERAADDADIAWLMNAEGTQGLLKAAFIPRENDFNPAAASISKLREICREVEASYAETGSGLNILVTGIPVLEHDELAGAWSDMTMASLLAVAAVTVLLTFGLRSIRYPMLIVLTLIVSLACTFGVTTLVIGHLNILSVCFTAVLAGLGVDFGIHFVSQYLHVRQQESDVAAALQRTGLRAGSGIFTSALTTALAFGSAALTGFPGIAELGIVAASGILISALCTFLFLPALMAASDSGGDMPPLTQPLLGRVFRKVIAAVPLVVVGLSAAGILAVGSRAVRWTDGHPEILLTWDDNLLHLQNTELDSVQAQQRIREQTGESLLYAVAVAESRSQALNLAEQLTRLPSVSHVKELASYLPDPPDARRAAGIRQIRELVRGVSTEVPTFRRVPARQIGTELDRLYRTVKASHHPRAAAPAERLNRFLDRMEALPPSVRQDILAAYQDLLAGSLLYQFQRVGRAAGLDQVQVAELPAAWRHRLYRKTDGREQWLLKIYPRDDIWDGAALAAFVEDIRTVVPNVTGIPIQNYESSRQLRESWSDIAVYSLAAIGLLLLFDFLRPGQKLLTLISPLMITGFIGYMMRARTDTLNIPLLLTVYLAMVAFIALVVDFRNLRDTLIALLPALGGAVLMAGVMSLLQISLTPLNLVMLPLVLGIGVDDGVHMVHDCRRQTARGKQDYSPSGDTLIAVILTSLTTIVGFGSLLIAGHQGLVGMGMVMVIGTAGSLLVAVVLLPALLTLVARYQPARTDPVVSPKRRSEKRSASADSEPGSDDHDDPDQATRPLTRREKRRLARAA